MTALRDNVERWLIHENYKFDEIKTDDDNFKIIIKNGDAFGNPLEIFEPKQQPNVLVVGIKVYLKNNHMVRYLKLTDEEKANFEQRVADFCYSIKAIHKFFYEDGKKKVGVYIVLDKKEQLNQPFLMKTMQEIAELSDKTARFIMKTF